MRARLALASLLALAGCQSAPPRPLSLAAEVDLARFMGDWYVIAATPTFIDGEAFGAVESYRLAADGGIATTYTFRAGGFEGEPRVYSPKGRVVPGTGNAVWTMQFVWPIRADYRIAWLAPDYSSVVVAREKRDYAWIMSRRPTLPDDELRAREAFLREAGYDTSKLRRIPQRAQEPRQ